MKNVKFFSGRVAALTICLAMLACGLSFQNNSHTVQSDEFGKVQTASFIPTGQMNAQEVAWTPGALAVTRVAYVAGRATVQFTKAAVAGTVAYTLADGPDPKDQPEEVIAFNHSLRMSNLD